MVTPARVLKPSALNCPNCGGTVELRGFAHTRSAVCVQCCTIIDASTPQLQILQKFDEKLRVRPLIPLGTRGNFRGIPYEVIGFQVRTINADGVDYSWHEYLLFNPYKGFRYLTQYDGHWNDVQTVHGLPTFMQLGSRKGLAYNNVQYKHFQNAVARTSFVMGEFPWAVQVGERNTVDDYVSPPYMMSSEMTDGEMNWSFGTYILGSEVEQAFQLKQKLPEPRGVYSNQPSPYDGKARSAWRTFLLLCIIWAALLAYFTFSAQDRLIFDQNFHFAQTVPGEHSFVTPVFDVPGKGNVEVILKTDLNNNWAYFNLALLREDGAQGFDFGRDVSYYHGTDSDGSWSEGKARDSVTVPHVPAGRYYLRIEPEMDPQGSATAASGMTMNYEVQVRRDVASTWILWVVFPFLLIPPIVTGFRSLAFEAKRWSESDYAPATSSDGDDD